MASNAVVPTQAPLSDFAKLSANTSLYRPDDKSPSATSSGGNSGDVGSTAGAGPRLIVICSWMGSRDQHIAKYTARLQALYPTSPILLIKSVKGHFTRPRSITADVQPAASAMRSILGASGPPPPDPATTRPEMLLLVFSNGGSTTLHHLYLAYAASSGDKDAAAALPPHATVFDSSPGIRFSYPRSVTAMTAGVTGARRLLLLPVVHLLLAYLWAALHYAPRWWPWRPSDPFAAASAAHNDKAGCNRREVRRAYVYSEEDALIDFRGIEEHARQAGERGFRVVRLEKFVGSPHVAHARTDEGRYWGVVRETWEGKREENGK
ncbi:hypothetical protein NKR23_g6691 [Pleurostoma richardsiae]|uniref:Indole-diterpene biosynthesis protein PaxU n=1 Tax=Pleurostoma richardsiae TaxID=41990 RepID=A0AA38RDG9_9PEZI|nr:hypothetical protein NKR23_g6691 [Pleurostoma richardsiae]